MKRRLGTTLADQALSSASNFLVVLAVARVSGVAEFGAFSLAFLVYQMALGLTKAGAGDVLLIRSTEPGWSGREDSRRALGFVLAFAATVAVGAGTVGALAGGALGGPLIAIAVVLVPALLQDCYRYVFFAHGAPRRAIAIDSAWLLLQLAGFALAATGTLPDSPAALVIVWGAASGLACLLGAALAGTLPALTGIAWIRTARGRAAGLMADFTLLTGASYIALAFVPLVAGLPTVAALRGAQLLFSPFLALLASVRVFALPLLADRLGEGPGPYRRTALRLAGALLALAGLYSGVVLLLPDGVGTQLLGDSWQSVEAILLPVSLAYMAQAISYPATEGLRAMGSAHRLVTTRAITAMATITLLVGGAGISGAGGAAVGMFLGRWGAAVLWQASLRAALTARRDDLRKRSAGHGERELELAEELTALDGENVGGLPGGEPTDVGPVSEVNPEKLA